MTVKYTGLIVASHTLPENYTKTQKITTKQQKRKKRKTNSHSHFQDESKKEEWRGRRRGGQETSSPIPLLPFCVCFCSRSNFRALVRLEQLAAPAYVISHVINFHRHNPDASMLLKGKYTEAAYWEFAISWPIYTLNTDPLGSLGAINMKSLLLSQEIPPQWLTWFDCDSESSVNGLHETSTSAPLTRCVLSVTFLASAKRTMPSLLIPLI